MITKNYNKLGTLWSMSYNALAYHLFIGFFVYFLHHHWNKIYFDLPVGVLSTMGIAISIFLGFRIKSSYDRWWEARIIWGSIVNYSRSFGRQVITLLDSSDEKKKELIYRHVGWLNALSQNLRKEEYNDNTRSFLTEEDKNLLDTAKNAPTQLIRRQAEEIKLEAKNNNLSDYRLIQLDNTLNEFYNLQGKCERIKNTPFPREIDILAKIFVLTFTTLVPFHLVDELGWGTIPITVLEGFIFYILENVSARYDDPFENEPQDTPMTALSRTIEIDLLQMLGEKDLPLPKVAKDGFLY